MEENKILRLYIMPEVWSTVTQSQVFNWIELINKDGNIQTDCLSMTPKKLGHKEVSRIENTIGGKFIQVPARLMVLEDVFLFFFLIKYYTKNKRKYDEIIFQTRLSSIGITYYLMKIFTSSKLIFEARAATNEETRLRNRGKKNDLKTRIKFWLSELSEKLMIRTPDKIFCVSHTLKDYYVKKYNTNEAKFSVFPGAADASLFYYDEKLRERLRKELAIKEDDIVVVYSGRLAKKWEIPDKIFAFFKNLQSKNSNFKLFIITPDIEIATKLSSDFNLENEVIIKKAELQEVNQYLNVSDIGMLLREDILMNNVASPTKFAEYLMSGLPVIISKGIYDFAKDINHTNYGVVVDSLDEISNDEYKKLENSLSLDKKTIAEWGKENLSKEVYIDENIRELKTI